MKAAVLSSRTGVSSIFEYLSIPRIKGVERDPGEKKMFFIPMLSRVLAKLYPSRELALAISLGCCFTFREE
jgi:hypothetical protein